jgi:UDP-sugar transporter A1/2/3
MALSDSKIMFWNGKVPSKSIHFDAVTDKDRTEQQAPAPTAVPTLCGMPLKYISYVFPFTSPLSHFPWDGGYSQSFGQTILTFSLPSLITLAVQNAALSLLMHYSRVSMPPSRAYSAASAVLATELLKGLISLLIALIRVRPNSSQHAFTLPSPLSSRLASSPLNPKVFLERCSILGKEVFRPDCWKLSIPAILYGQLCMPQSFYISH